MEWASLGIAVAGIVIAVWSLMRSSATSKKLLKQQEELEDCRNRLLVIEQQSHAQDVDSSSKALIKVEINGNKVGLLNSGQGSARNLKIYADDEPVQNHLSRKMTKNWIRELKPGGEFKFFLPGSKSTSTGKITVRFVHESGEEDKVVKQFGLD